LLQKAENKTSIFSPKINFATRKYSRELKFKAINMFISDFFNRMNYNPWSSRRHNNRKHTRGRRIQEVKNGKKSKFIYHYK